MERIGIYEWTVVLLGMGTVFIALIGLSLVLYVFSLAAKLGKGGAGKARSGSSPEAPSPKPAVPASAGVPPELVAVITAAVAAASGRPASALRISGIRPSEPGVSGLNTPVWGYADRLSAGRRG